VFRLNIATLSVCEKLLIFFYLFFSQRFSFTPFSFFFISFVQNSFNYYWIHHTLFVTSILIGHLNQFGDLKIMFILQCVNKSLSHSK